MQVQASDIARQQGLDLPETGLDNGAIWGWFEGVADVDDIDDAPVRHARSSWANELMVTCCSDGSVGGNDIERKSSTALTENRDRSHEKSW